MAKTQLAYTQVRAPIAGCVLKHYARLGEAVGPGSLQPLLVMADLSQRRVRAWVEDLDVRRVYQGQRVAVTADGFPGREFRGQVTQLLLRMGQGAPRSDRPNERHDAYSREVLIELEKTDDLLPGLRVEVRFLADKNVSESD